MDEQITMHNKKIPRRQKGNDPVGNVAGAFNGTFAE
jgi:hypothetical protein